MRKIFVWLIIVIFFVTPKGKGQCGHFLGGDKVVVACTNPFSIDFNDLFVTNATLQLVSLDPKDVIQGVNGIDTVISYVSKTQVFATATNGCTDVATVRTVYARHPIPALGPDKIINVCPGIKTDLTLLYNTGLLAANWNTTVPENAGSGVYTLVVTNLDGCSDEAIVTINELTKPDGGRDTTIVRRFEDKTNLNNFVNLNGLTPSWNIADPTQAGEGNYNVVVINIDGCLDTVFINIENHPKPNLGPDKKICSNQSVDLTELFDTTGLVVNYGTSNPHAVGPGSYRIIATNSFNSKDTVVIEVLNNNMAELGLHTVQKCANEYISLTTYFDLTGLQATWSVSDPERVYDPGIYSVVATNQLGCKKTGTVVVELNAIPFIHDTVVTICGNNKYDLTTLFNTSAYMQVNWTAPDPTAAEPGDYSLSFFDEFGCTYVINVRVISYTVTTPPLDLCIFNTGNSAFSTNQIRTVVVDKDNQIWAGLDGGGLYNFSRGASGGCVGTWRKYSQFSSIATYKDLIAVDQDSLCQCSSGDIGVWAGSTGHSGIQAITGGVYHFKDNNFTAQRFGSIDDITSNGKLSSRFVNSLALGANGKLYAALGQSQRTSNASILEGGVYEIVLSGNDSNFTTTPNIVLPETDIRVTCAGTRGNEVWFAVDRSCLENGGCFPGYIIKYNTGVNAQTGAIRNPLPFTSDGNTVVIKSIFTDSSSRTFVGMSSGKGIAVYDAFNNWHFITSTNSLFPNGASVNFNAITQINGEIWIGTNKGLLVYNGFGDFNDCDSYKLYTTEQNLPSNNVTDIAYDVSRFEVWIATDAGLCLTAKSNAVTGTILDVSCGKYDDIQGALNRMPVSGAKVSLRESDGTLIDQVITGVDGSFILENGEVNKKYKVTVEYKNKYKFEYKDILSDRFLGDILIPDSLIRELKLFLPLLAKKKYDYSVFGISQRDSIEAKGYDTTAFSHAYRVFLDSVISDFHVKRVEDLASFYATTACMYNHGNASNDMFVQMINSWVEVAKLALKALGISEKLSLEKLDSKGSLGVSKDYAMSDLTKAQVKKFDTYFSAIENVYKRAAEKYITDPETKKYIDYGITGFKKVKEFCVSAAEKGLTGNFQMILDQIVGDFTSYMVKQIGVVQYERFCNERHAGFIQRMADKTAAHSNFFRYEKAYNSIYSLTAAATAAQNSRNKKLADSVLYHNTAISMLKSAGETLEEINSYSQLLALLAAASVVGAELAPLFELVAAATEAAKVFSTISVAGYSLKAYNNIDDMSDFVEPQSGFPLVRRQVPVAQPIQMIELSFAISPELLNEKTIYNQRLNEFKSVVNVAYDSTQFSNKLKALLSQKTNFERALDKNIVQFFPYSGYAMNNVEGFERNFAVVIDSFAILQQQHTFALISQIQAYMLDTIRSRRVPRINTLVDKLKLFNDSVVSGLVVVKNQLDGVMFPLRPYLEQDSFKMYFNNQVNTNGKSIHSLMNSGNTAIHNLSLKITPPNNGFSLLSPDSIFIGTLQPGQRKNFEVLFKAPAYDTLGSYSVSVKSNSSEVLMLNTLLMTRTAPQSTDYVTVKNGVWSDSAIWSGGVVPPAGANVVINHFVFLDKNAECKSFKIKPFGYIIVNPSVRLSIIK